MRWPSFIKKLTSHPTKCANEDRVFEPIILKFSYCLSDLGCRTILRPYFSKPVREILIKICIRNKETVFHAITEFYQNNKYSPNKICKWRSGIWTHNSKILPLFTGSWMSNDFATIFLKTCELNFDQNLYTRQTNYVLCDDEM